MSSPILFLAKSAPLISMPVQVAGHYNPDGTYVKPHMRMQKVAMQPHQAHAHASAQAKTEPTRLDAFIEKHGGTARLRDELADMKPEQRAKLIDAMAHIDGVEPHAVMERLGMHDEAKPKAEAEHEIVEHVTGKEKTLRGVVRHDLSKEQAEEIDPYTFKKNGGWFIREKHMPAKTEAKEEQKAAEPAPAPEPEVKPEPKTEPEPEPEPRNVPEGWTGRTGGMITNTNPVHGGIIDHNGEGWFVIPHNVDVKQMEGFPTQQAAVDALASAVANAGEEARQKAIELHAAMKEKAKSAEPEAKDEQEGPKDGDTKEGAEGTLVFRDGRWRKQDEPKGAPTDPESVQRQELAEALSKNPHSNEAKEKLREVAHEVAGQDDVPEDESDVVSPNLQKLRDKIEQMGGREKVAEILQQSRKTDKSRSEKLVDSLAEAMGVTRDEVMGELGLKEVAVKRSGGSRTKIEPASLDIDDPDNPNSKNYRYADTGHVAGSRKELASARAVIDLAKKDGARVYTTAINWEQIEENPREAKNLITKSNLFGAVDWSGLGDKGMEPDTGFIIDRIYASIGTEPSEDSAQARKDYTTGLQTIRDRLEACKTPDDVDNVLADMRAEYDGTMMNAEESAQYKDLRQEDHALAGEERDLRGGADGLYADMNRAQSAKYGVEHEIRKRKDRGWKTEEHEAKLKVAQAEHEKAADAWKARLDEHRPRQDEIRSRREAIHKQMRVIQLAAIARNELENPMHRAWKTMGDRFVGVIKYRGHKGSDAFANHMASVKSGKVKDWSWAEKEVTKGPRVTKEGERFQLQVADTYERKGGRDVTPDSTIALKETFGLRDVQSGNWVLRDPVSAKFHTEQAAGAFADLADLLGTDDKTIALNGRLALAFGARGAGGKGAARAHYEPVHRIINQTKMGGGGCLGHEWFHALDNMIVEAETGKAAAIDVFATETPALLPPGELRDAFQGFRDAMWSGEHRIAEAHGYLGSEVAHIRRILDRPSFNRGGPTEIIRNAGNVHEAFQKLDAYFKTEGGKASGASKRTQKISKEWKQLAAAHFGGNSEGGTIRVESGKAMSSFAMEASRLDLGTQTYWATTEEMAARAFQGWIEDSLAAKDRRNDYLSNGANNKVYAMMEEKWKPYPEGEERKTINKAIDRLVSALQANKSLQKACDLLG